MRRKRPFVAYSTLETKLSMALPTDCGRVTGKSGSYAEGEHTGWSQFMR
jgi:hypothetical protein